MKRLMLKADLNGEVKEQLDLSDARSEISVAVEKYRQATIQIVVRTSATIGNVTIHGQQSNDGTNSAAFATTVTFVASGISALCNVWGIGYLHVKNIAAADPSTGTGFADVYIKLS